MPIGRLGPVAAAFGALALVLGASAPAGPDPWRDAAGKVSFPVYQPAVTLGFAPGPVVVERCFDRSNGRVRASYSRGSAVFGFEENYPRFCGDAGERVRVGSAEINGAQVHVAVYCRQPGPKCTVEDGFRNGFHLELRPPGPKQPMIAVYSARVALPDLLSVVRSLTRVPKPSTVSAAPAAVGRCSNAEATAVVGRLGLGDASLPNPVYAVLCGAFAGPGSQAMAVSLATGGTSVPFGGWAVLRRDGSTWQLVMQQRNGARITAAGSGIRETVGISRPGDSRCCPTGGERSRVWRWNGTRFVASAWTQSKPATQKAPSTVPSGSYVKTPSGNIVCAFWTGGNMQPSVGCRIKTGLRSPPTSRRPECSPSFGISLKATGRAQPDRSICPGEDEGDAGVLAYESVAQVLPYGTTRSSGGIRCTSRSTGLTCRNTSGHGFFLSRERWRAF